MISDKVIRTVLSVMLMPWLVACADDMDLADYGASCTVPGDCVGGYCVELGGGGVCSRDCVSTGCPNGDTCVTCRACVARRAPPAGSPYP